MLSARAPQYPRGDQLATSVHAKGANSSMHVPVILRKLRAYWDLEIHDNLHVITPYLSNRPPTSKTHCTEVTLCRLRIGHMYRTHACISYDGDPPSCDRCGLRLSILLLLECQNYKPIGTSISSTISTANVMWAK